MNDAINYLLIHVYLMTHKAIEVNYSYWPDKCGLSEVVHFCLLVDLLQYNYYNSNGKLNETQLHLSLAPDVHRSFKHLLTAVSWGNGNETNIACLDWPGSVLVPILTRHLKTIPSGGPQLP